MATRSRKRRFEDSDDSDSPTIIASPKKKRRRTLQLSQSDEESTKKSKTTNNTKRKHKKPTNRTVNRTPKPLKLTEAKPMTPISAQPASYNNISSPSPLSPHNTNANTKKVTSVTSAKKNTAKKQKTPPKSHDIRNFFTQCSAKDYFSKFDNKPNYNNLKKQTSAVKNIQNKNKNKNKPNGNIYKKDESEPDDDDDNDLYDEDIEMKSISKPNENSPLKRRKKSPSPKKKNKNPKNTAINHTFAKLSCDATPSANLLNTNTNTDTNKKPDKQMTAPKPIPPIPPIPVSTVSNGPITGKKRKLDEISNENTKSDDNPPKKAKKFYPGFRRNDAPPMHGKTPIPTGKPYCLSGIRFVITGLLPSLTRDECSDLIMEYGGKTTKAVSGMTRYLVAGEEAGPSKLQKAKEKKVTIITESDLLDLIRTNPQGKPAQTRAKKKTKKNNNMLPNRGANNKNDILFVDKYAPVSSGDLIGNNKCIKDLRQFLIRWDSIKNKGIRGKDGVKKGILLSGQPGIGKTSAINVVARELDFDVIEFNASDTRSKKALKNVIEQSLNNSRMTDFFGAATKNKNKNKNSNNNAKLLTAKQKKRNLIIMDEVDGMSSGDRGGVQELISCIDKSKIPIICICNDRSSPKIRTLGTYCLDLRFRKPTAAQITNRLYNIARNEGFQCDMPTIQKLADGTNGDIRQMLHLLQFWSNSYGSKNLTFSDIKNKLQSTNRKDLTVGPWDVVPKLFYSNTPILKGLQYYFVDYSLIPLMIQENYLNLNRKPMWSKKELLHISKASLSISDGDIIDHNIRTSQQYAALPYHGVLSSIKIAKYIADGGCGRVMGRTQFPMWFAKNSSRRKNERLFSELAMNMNSTPNVVSMESLLILKEKMINPLKNEGANGIERAVEFMKVHNITRNDWDTVYTLGDFKKVNKSDIATKVKTAFTKRCKAELSVTNIVKSKKKMKGTIGDLKIKNMDDEDEESEKEEEEEDDDITKDSLIKVKKGKKGKKKKGKTTAKNRKKRTKKKKKEIL